MASTPAKGTYCVVSLGCPKNLIDSECMLGHLDREGYRLVPEPQGADFVVINTCGFLEVARQESLAVIDEMLALKRQGRLGGVIVAGCLAERAGQRLLADRPEIDQLLGVFARQEIAAAAGRVMTGDGSEKAVLLPKAAASTGDGGRLRLTPKHVAYLRIAEGCDRHCSFCTIPQIRGRYVSKPEEVVVAEAERLAAEGARELILVAQDLTWYGMDVGARPRLAHLLRRLTRVDRIDWIRLMYLYPMHVTDELIDLLAAGGKVLPYVDLPLQHISDRVLQRMNRPVRRRQIEALVERLRERIPGLVLRTTMIVGFPGETE
ncbi:MAG TPA: MiaB/RimO family radical SAM methylthiotransferase, partial [Planctomycetaceae bacterium]|nr:MiaB/RimO family radical SAM methylthiotransferase [Planctomycetaceae bacterium]